MNDRARAGSAKANAVHPIRRAAVSQPDIKSQASEFGIEDEIYDLLLSQRSGSKHPERYILGKPHPDRAKQFKPFAALRGYEELVAEVMARAAEPHDFSKMDEPC